MLGNVFCVLSLRSTWHARSPKVVGNTRSSRCFREFESYWMSWSGFAHVVTVDRGLHNHGSFACGLLSNGTYLPQTAVEAPEQVGQAERHEVSSYDNHQRALGGRQEQLKLCLTVATEDKNNQMRRGGDSQPRRLRLQGEEDERKTRQLGALSAQQDSTTSLRRIA